MASFFNCWVHDTEHEYLSQAASDLNQHGAPRPVRLLPASLPAPCAGKILMGLLLVVPFRDMT